MQKVKRTFRFYPTKEQEVLLSKTFGCTRFIYNEALAWRKKEFADGNKPNYRSSSAWLTEFKKDKSFLNEVSCVPLQQSLRHLQTSYSNFFKKRANFPKFKSRSNQQSCEFTKSAFTFKNNHLCLAKIGKIKVAWSMKVENPSTVTVIKKPTGKYFVTLTVMENPKTFPKLNSSVGIDLGVETYATFNDGHKIKMPDNFKKARVKLKKASKNLSRKIKGSKGFEKARIEVALCHERIVNIRKDFLNKLSTSIVRENQTISIEDLHVKSMLKDKKMAKSNSQQGWRMFRAMLEYKCAWYERELVVVNRWTPTTKTCSVCKAMVELTLKQREWECSCGAKHDRDVNAAINILAAGHAVSASGSEPFKTCVLKGKFMKLEPPI